MAWSSWEPLVMSGGEAPAHAVRAERMRAPPERAYVAVMAAALVFMGVTLAWVQCHVKRDKKEVYDTLKFAGKAC